MALNFTNGKTWRSREGRTLVSNLFGTQEELESLVNRKLESLAASRVDVEVNLFLGLWVCGCK